LIQSAGTNRAETGLAVNQAALLKGMSNRAILDLPGD